ncbi:hypothetical protein TUM3794_20920 [Shewanella colwelliana]|uniref:Type I restriction modification DNA specificity domain-containing protein n=1 Tax=Shewanella colwelliana TaxID=23 RepID=A0ABQ4P100_SHECO|nr:restriction endonuclease subunit S [Shewanella colwelliana]GIU41125.1 hypothetical protein TUM3794_20920 [Shewanella colwelliana]
MRSNFQTLKLRDVIEIVIDNRGRNPKSYSDYGVPVIDNYLIVSEAEADLSQVKRYIDEHTYNTFIRKYISKGDVLMTLVGNGYGKVAITPEQQCIIIQNTIGLRCNKDNDNLYLYYLLKANREVLMNLNRGAAQPSIKVGDILDLEFTFPPLHIQQKIGSTLGDLDKKSSLNSQANQTLEEMAQAIFKSWFVDFDPVKAKMNGEQPEGMDAATASLFPEKLVESELGLIPEGWSVEQAKSQFDVLRGFSYKGKGLVGSLDEGVPMHNLNSVLEGGGYKYAGLKFYSEEFKEKFAIQEGDVLVANTEQGHNHLLIGYGAMVPKHLAHGFFSHHTYRVRPKNNSNMTPEFIERLFGKGRFVRQVQGFTNGTTVNMLPVAGMEMPQFIVPSKALTQKFSVLVKPIKAMIEENHKSNIELAKLRDTLLSKLLSGEITLD